MYNHVPENYVCPFCLLVQGIENERVHSVQSDIVYRDSAVTAFISAHQWPHNHGNVIIVPNEHIENIYDLPDHYAADIHRATKRLAMAMKVAYACDGVSTRQHNEPAGNQDVWHYHVHVTPRYQDDQFYFGRRELMPVAQRARLAEKLAGSLEQLEHVTFSDITAKGLSRYLVGASLDPQKLRLHVSEVEPGGRPHGAHTHAGVEAFYVLEGQVTVEIEDERYTLGPNEALALDGRRPHGIFGSGATRARYLVIIAQ